MSDHLPPMPTCRYCGTPADECEEGHAERCGDALLRAEQCRYENEYKTGDPGDPGDVADMRYIMTGEQFQPAHTPEEYNALFSETRDRVLYPIPLSIRRYVIELVALLALVALLGYILGGM